MSQQHGPVPVHDQPTGPDERGLVSYLGPVEVQWLRSAGYFGGIGLALALEIIDPPLALFIAAVPFLKMMNRPHAPLPMRMFAQLVDGAAKPVGGDAEGTIKLTAPDKGAESASRSAVRRGTPSRTRRRTSSATDAAPRPT